MMRNAIKEYIEYSHKEKNDLWNTATFVFDTNVFLNLYRYSNKTRDQLIESFEWLKSRIWMPYQVALEFCKERYSVINEANRRFDNIGAQAGTLVDSWRKELRLDANDSDVEELAKYMEGWIRKKKESNYCIFDAADDYGSLSVAFESPALIDMGTPAISAKFTVGLNEALLRADSFGDHSGSSAIDAFGIPFEPIEEPMPEVKLAGGFDVKLRTMFKEQRCQTRYARIENASYPISPRMRKSLQTALNWLGSAEYKDITWINTDKSEILFAYPSQLPETKISFTRMFKCPEKRDKAFEEQAKQFLSELRQSHKVGTDSHADRIQLFILRKIDKARTKVIYTRQMNGPMGGGNRGGGWGGDDF